MKVVKELTHGILLNYFSIRGQSHLVVSVLTFFDLDAPDTSLSEQEMWRFVPLALGDNAVLDAAMPKARAEVLLKARCFAPGGVPRPVGQVALRVGQISKKLDVFGPRFWQRGVAGWAISDPEPFTAIDIDWPNAFGGPDFPLNPLGRGAVPGTTASGATRHELPAVEDPARRIGAPGDRPAPGGFMPIDQSWPQRRAKVGTYDQKWFQTHWPYFPEDMNWTFFNAAPEDQQQDTFFQGGEAVELINMHPERQVVSACLPRLRQRVFVNQFNDPRDPAQGLMFREGRTQLDTVWLFPHALRGIAVYRCVLPVAEEEAVDVKQLYLVTESPDEAPKSLAHHLEALNKRLDRSVQVDMSQLDAALARAALDLKQVEDIPKALAHSLAVAKGDVPNAGLAPRNAAAQCLALLDQSRTRMLDAEKQLADVKDKFGHMVRIDLTPLSRARDEFEQLKETIHRQMDAADALTQKAKAAKEGMQDKVLKALDRPATRSYIPRVQAQMAPPGKAPWHEQALERVRQGRYDLSLDHERMAALRGLGLRPVTLKRAMLAVMPREWSFVPEAWGLDPAPPVTLPAGLVLVAHEGAHITRLDVRSGPLENGADDITVPGSQATPFSAGLAPGKAVVRVADPLEAWLVEQAAGEFVGAVALADPQTVQDKQTAALLQETGRLLIVIYDRDPVAIEKAFAPWRAAYPQAEPLALPAQSAILDAHHKGVALEQWIVAALGPDQAPFVPDDSPLRAGKAGAAAGIALPSVDAKGLYQVHHDGMMQKMAPMLEKSEALKQALPRKMDAAIEQARAQMTKDGLQKHGIDPQACFKPASPAKPPEGFMAGMDLPAKYAHIRSTLATAGQLTPERAAALDAQEAKMTGVLAASKAQWAAGQAKRVDAGAGFVFPDWARDLLASFHIDPADTEAMTRETVIARHADHIPLKGKNLNGLDLSGLDLSGADLRGARMQMTLFTQSNLDGADLSGTIADGADFTGASFRNGKAVQALLDKAVFAGAALGGTDFTKALLKAADLSRADLSGSILEQTLLEGANLAGATLTGAKAAKGYFMGADLTGADFTDADAAKAVFLKATTENARFSGTDLGKAIFWDVRADGAGFHAANLDNARFGGTASVTHGDFSAADLSHASLIDADLSNANFKGAKIQRAYLRNCNLSRVDLSGVQAQRTFLHRTNLEGADLSGANLCMGSLRKARLVDADLSRTNLYGVEMYRAEVGRTRFEAANLKMTLLHNREALLDDPQ